MADNTNPKSVTPFAMCTCAVCGPPWRNEPDYDPADFMWNSWMTLCPECGNKRCPGAVDHTLPCSHSNDPEENAKAWGWIKDNK